MQCTYWLEWFLQFDQICKNNKIKLLCETRSHINVDFQFQKDTIWLIWDAIFNENNNRDNYKKLKKKILNSLLDLFTIKFIYSCKKKRKSLIYFAISLITDPINFNISICENPDFTNNVVNKIDTIYKDVKKNEVNPKTDYLFANVKQDNLDKTISKIELMNNFENNYNSTSNINLDNEEI